MYRPIGGEASGRSTDDRIPQCDIPSRRPSAYDKAKFVEYLIDQPVKLLWILIEFGWSVTNTSIEVVAVHLDYAMLSADERKHAPHLVG